MNWNQIEVKWAEMALRVRADLRHHRAMKSDEGRPTGPHGAAPKTAPPEVEETGAE